MKFIGEIYKDISASDRYGRGRSLLVDALMGNDQEELAQRLAERCAGNIFKSWVLRRAQDGKVVVEG